MVSLTGTSAAVSSRVDILITEKETITKLNQTPLMAASTVFVDFAC